MHYYFPAIYGLIDLDNRRIAQEEAASIPAAPPEPAIEPCSQRSPAYEVTSAFQFRAKPLATT